MASNQRQLEQKEQQAIAYIRSNIDLTDKQMVAKVYRQLIHQNTFQTPAGLAFVKELEGILSEKPKDDAPGRTKDGERLYTKEEVLTELRKLKQIQERKVQMLAVSTTILGIMVVLMLAISLTSKLPTIVNYKQVVTDEYASWDVELRNREEALRERERALLEKETQYVDSMESQRTYYDTQNMDALDDTEATEDTGASEDAEANVNDEE